MTSQSYTLIPWKYEIYCIFYEGRLKSKLNDATSQKKLEYFPSKGFVILDRTSGLMRAFYHSMCDQKLELSFFNETFASWDYDL